MAAAYQREREGILETGDSSGSIVIDVGVGLVWSSENNR